MTNTVHLTPEDIEAIETMLGNYHSDKLVGAIGVVETLRTMLDLFESPRNIDELWVWRRACWMLAGCNETWEANRVLCLLVEAQTKIELCDAALLKLHWWQWRKRAIMKAYRRLFAVRGNVCAVMRRNWALWPDKEKFTAFAGLDMAELGSLNDIVRVKQFIST